MSEKVPHGWDTVSLKNICDIKHGYAFAGEFFASVPNDYILLTPGNFNIDGSLYYGAKTKYYTGPIPDEYVLKNGDLLVVMTDLTSQMAILGNAVILQSEKVNLHNQRIGKVVNIRANISSEFLRLIFNSELVKNIVRTTATGTTVRHTSPTKMLDATFALPTLAEQKKIASILTSVDEVIETTQKQIDKLQNLKKATMNELLTKGIGHTEFKDSELGRIPKSWEVKTLDSLTLESAFGPRFSSEYYSNDGNIGCIRTTDMNDNWDIDYSTVPLAQLKIADFESHILQNGDLLVTRSGTCGLVDVFKQQPVPMVAGAFLIRFRLNKEVNPWFIRYSMMTSHIQETIQLLASGGVQKNLSGSNLKKLFLPLPSLKEQDEIVEHIEHLVKSVSLVKKKNFNFNFLKKSLMQDLLTGKVRVQVN